MSIKSTIYSKLSTDAQVNNTANLGGSTMLNQASTSPFGLYYHHPPAEPVSPFLTYHEGTASGEHPRLSAVYVNVWGKESDDITLIMDRVHFLLERQQLALTTDHRFLQLVWDWHSDEIWHDGMELFNREDRFIVKSRKTSNVSI